MTLQTLLSLCILIAFCWFLYKRLLTYSQYFQQEEYDNRRFLQWLLQDKVFDRRVSLAILVMAGLSMVISSTWWLIIVTVVFCCAAYFEANPQHTGKKKLILINTISEAQQNKAPFGHWKLPKIISKQKSW